MDTEKKGNDSAFSGGASFIEGADDSVFSIFNRKEAPPAPPPPPVPPPPPAPPGEELAQTQFKTSEAGIAAFFQKKISELEKRLYETQEKALAFSLELKNKDELQRQAIRQVEDMFKSLRSGQHTGETEKRLENRLAGFEQTVSGLKERLDVASGWESRLAEETQKRLAGIEQALSGLKERLEEAREWERRSAGKTGDRLAGFEQAVLGLRERLEEVREWKKRSADETEKRLEEKIYALERSISGLKEQVSEAREVIKSVVPKDLRSNFELLERRLGQIETGGVLAGQEAAGARAKMRALEAKLGELEDRSRHTESFLKDSGDRADRGEERAFGLESRCEMSEEALGGLHKQFDSILTRIAELEGASRAYGDVARELREKMEKADRKAGESSARQGIWGAAIEEFSSRFGKLGEKVRQLAVSESATAAALKKLGGQLSGLEEKLAAIERAKAGFVELSGGIPAENLHPVVWKVAALESALAELSGKISRLEAQQARPAPPKPPLPPIV